MGEMLVCLVLKFRIDSFRFFKKLHASSLTCLMLNHLALCLNEKKFYHYKLKICSNLMKLYFGTKREQRLYD